MSFIRKKILLSGIKEIMSEYLATVMLRKYREGEGIGKQLLIEGLRGNT
jgi:hypothetical protein